MMTEHPILFSSEMVRAILEGRKTQTRRVIKPQPPEYCNLWAGWTTCCPDEKEIGKANWTDQPIPIFKNIFSARCPYGKPGDTLWVKEALYRGEWGNNNDAIYYQADESPVWDVGRPAQWCWGKSKLPSMFCLKGLSRLTLKVIGIGVERVKDISPEDVLAEGMPDGIAVGDLEQIKWFANLWDIINAKHGFSFEENPWVWNVEFEDVNNGQ